MHNEALHLQQMVSSCEHRARVLAVTSGKGGVGKSNISANLAICLASAGKKTLLLDGDLSLSNIDLIMGLSSKFNVWHLLNGRKSLEEIIHAGPAGVEVICGTSGLEQLANLNQFHQKRLLDELSGLQENNDIIVVDTAAGICKSVIGFCLAADNVLVVTTPQATAMTDAYAMIKVLVCNNFDGKISLLVNMAATVAEGKKTYRQIANVVRRFLNAQVYEAGVLLRDERLAAAVQQRKPVVLAYPKAQISLSLAALAAKLSSGTAAQLSNQGFFKKVVDWFL